MGGGDDDLMCAHAVTEGFLARCVEFRKHVVQENDWFLIGDLFDDVDFEKFERQDDRPHLAAGRTSECGGVVE